MHSYIYLCPCGRPHCQRKYWHILPLDSFEFCLLWFRHFSYRYVGDLIKRTFLFSFFFCVVTWFCKSFSVFSIFCCLHSESHQSVITHFSYFSPVENSNWHDIYLQFVLHFILNHRSWFLYTSSSNDDFVVTTCNSGFVVCIEFSIISLKFFFLTLTGSRKKDSCQLRHVRLLYAQLECLPSTRGYPCKSIYHFHFLWCKNSFFGQLVPYFTL